MLWDPPEFQRLSTVIQEESLLLSRQFSLDVQKKRNRGTLRDATELSIGFLMYTSAKPVVKYKKVTQLLVFYYNCVYVMYCRNTNQLN